MSPARSFTIALTLLVMAAFIRPLAAGSLQEVTAERDRLRVQLAEAQLKIHELERRIEVLERQLAAHGPEAPDGQASDEQPGDPETAPTEAVKTYRGLRQIFVELPRNARPEPDRGWTQFVKPKAEAWLKQNIVGAKLRLLLEIKSVSVRGVFSITEQNEPAGWEAVVDFAPSVEKVFDIPHKLSLGLAHRATVAITEEQAKRLRHFEPGAKRMVSGTMAGIGFGFDPHTVTVNLSDVTVKGIND
jgi:hypothetical protein